MRPHRLLPLGLLLALAACATPQQRCIGQVTRDLQVVDQLIAQTKLNIDRGYGVRERTDFVTDWDWCQPPGFYQDRNGNIRRLPPQMCDRDRAVTRRYPVAIDLDAERHKLAGLEAKRSDLAARATGEVAQCRQLYPDR